MEITYRRRSDSDFFGVFKDESLWYRVGLFYRKSLFSEEVNPNPYQIHKARFKTQEQAEVVCEMLFDEYHEGVHDGIWSS
jgi:hypothetical protein